MIGTPVNNAGGSIISTGAGSVITVGVTGSVTGGSLTASDGGTVVIDGIASPCTVYAQTGTVRIDTGNLAVAGVVGSLTQTGGHFSLGSTPTVASISGDFIQTGGELDLAFAGSSAAQASELVVAGNATLNGTVSFQAAAGFAPGAYASFPIADVSGTTTGSFGLTEGQVVNVGGYSFDVTLRGGTDDKTIALYSGVNPADVNISTATAGQPASVSGVFNSANNGTTYTFQSLDVLPGASDTLGPNDTLTLTNGPLYVAPGAVFTGNGIVNGNIINAGLVRIPIVKLTATSIIYGGQVAIPSPPAVQNPAVLPAIEINPKTAVVFYGATGSADGGEIEAGVGAGGGPIPVVINTPAVSNPGTIVLPQPSPAVTGYDASLEVTGSYTQQATGALRLFIGGDQQGVTYSELIVGQQVTLSGDLQIVLEPDLFGFVPTPGEEFDLVESPQGIAISSPFAVVDMVTASGASYFPTLATTAYQSNVVDDPDNLLQLDSPVFTYAVVEKDGQSVLEATYVGVPEPTAVSIALLAAGASVRRRKSDR